MNLKSRFQCTLLLNQWELAKRSLLISPHQTRLLRMLINGSIEVRGKSPNESYHISYAQMPNGDIGVIGGYLKDINPDEGEASSYH